MLLEIHGESMALPSLVKPIRIPSTVTMMEQHYSVRELADKWGFTLEYIRKLFQDEPGVLTTRSKNGKKRGYGVLRIPASVAERVYGRMQV